VAAGRRAVVAGELEVVDLVHDWNRPGEVGREDHARLERRDEERLPAGVVGCDLTPELRDARRDLLGAEVDLPDAVVGD
jgi:hypothetical protein